MSERPLTVTELVNARIYGQSRKTSRSRVGRQDFAAKRDRLTGTQPWFLTPADRDGLLARLQALRAPTGFDGVYFANVEPCVRMLTGAVESYKRPGVLVVVLSHRNAALLGNVLRRLDGPIPGLARIDAIACRDERRAS